MEISEEDLTRAIANARNRSFADLVALILGLAAQTHPQEIREALGRVFNFKEVEEYIKRTMLLAQSAQQMAHEAKMKMKDFWMDLSALEKRIDYLHLRLDEAKQKAAL